MNIKETFAKTSDLRTSVANGRFGVGDVLNSSEDNKTYIVVPSKNSTYEKSVIEFSLFEKLRNSTTDEVLPPVWDSEIRIDWNDTALDSDGTVINLADAVVSLASAESLSFGSLYNAFADFGQPFVSTGATGINVGSTANGFINYNDYSTNGRSAYGLDIPHGTLSRSNQPLVGYPNRSIRSTGYDYSSDSIGETLVQPGITSGTRVSCANPNESRVPRQEIIDSLNTMCEELDIYIQITYNGGWTTREAGTQNHPTGHAADFQIVSGMGIVRPKDETVLYQNIVKTLVRNARTNDIRPGIGGYPGFIHYDESPWRQPAKTSSNTLKALCGHWNSGFYITDTIRELL